MKTAKTQKTEIKTMAVVLSLFDLVTEPDEEYAGT